jgi:outer membrane protein TolC
VRPTLLIAWLAVLQPPQSLSAQDVRPLTEEESVRLGLETSAGVRAARAAADEAHAVHDEARGSLLPTIRGEASYTRLSNNIPDAEFTLPGTDTRVTLLPTELDRYHTELRLEQPLFTGFRLRNEMRAAGHQASASDLAADQAAADQAFAIRRAYWELQAALVVRESVDRAVADVERHLEDVQNRVDAGAALTRDLLAAETRHAEVLLERVEADNAVRVGQLELNRLIGLPLDTPLDPVDSVVVAPLQGSAAELAAGIVESRPELRAMGEEVRALDRRLSATRGDWLPELALVGRYVYAQPNQYYFLEPEVFNPNWEVGVSASWNLWEGGRRPARSRQVRASLDAASARLEEAREETLVEVTRQVLEVRRAAEAVEVADRNVRSAEEAFRVAGQQFEEGAALSADVLDAEEAYRTARSRHARAVADYAIARAALLAAEGRVR